MSRRVQIYGQVMREGVRGVVRGRNAPPHTSLPSISAISPSISCLSSSRRFTSSTYPYIMSRTLHTLPSRPFLHVNSLSSSYHSCRALCPAFMPSSAQSCGISTSPLSCKTRIRDADAEPSKENKRKDSPLVILVDVHENVSVMSLIQAERLAKQRDLKLVHVENPTLRKDGKPVYRMMTGKQYFEEVVKGKSEKHTSSAFSSKDEKTLGLSGNITAHDLKSKLHNIAKWLSKGHQVKVTIAARKASQEQVENVYSTVEKEVTSLKGRILQRHKKMDDIRFYIAPLKEAKNTSDKETAGEKIE